MRRSFLAAALSIGVSAAVEAQNAPAPLPEGPEKALVEAVCTTCHAADLITSSSGYTRDDWRTVMRTMVDLPDSAAARIGGIAERFGSSAMHRDLLELAVREESQHPAVGGPERPECAFGSGHGLGRRRIEWPDP